jgi:hypothetical protein
MSKAKNGSGKRVMYVNLSEDLQKKIAAYCDKVQRETGIEQKSSAVIRSFVERGLKSVEK